MRVALALVGAAVYVTISDESIAEFLRPLIAGLRGPDPAAPHARWLRGARRAVVVLVPPAGGGGGSPCWCSCRWRPAASCGHGSRRRSRARPSCASSTRRSPAPTSV